MHLEITGEEAAGLILTIISRFLSTKTESAVVLWCVRSNQTGRDHACALRPEVEHGREVHRPEETAE